MKNTKAFFFPKCCLIVMSDLSRWENKKDFSSDLIVMSDLLK